MQRLSIAQVIETRAALYGDERRQLVTFEPNEKLEAVFGRYPRLDDIASPGVPAAA